LFLFNPSHEMALAANAARYTPTKHIQRMETDLAMLPALLADDGDLILTPDGICDCHGHSARLDSSAVPMPWGWNRSVRNRFVSLGVDKQLMPTEEELDEWRLFASRKWSAEYNRKLYLRLGSKSWLVGNQLDFCCDGTSLSAWQTAHPYLPFIIKSEYSSSGRGNRVVRDAGQAASLKVNRVAADHYYNKVLDFAMEFEVADDGVRYLGLSVFRTSGEGKYMGNCVASQQDLSAMVRSCMPACWAEAMPVLAEAHRTLLSESIQGHYRGMVGIDMMVTDGGLLHPCVEINLRMNMGIVAMMLHKRGLTEIPQTFFSSTQFYPEISDNCFRIAVRRQ
jgi:hypothetical protein